MSAALLMSMFGVFLSATRLNALILFALIPTSIFTGRMRGAYRFRWLILLAVIAYGVGADERLQRFRSLQDPEFIAERFSNSVNLQLPGAASQLSARQRARRRRHQRALLSAGPDPERRGDGERVRADPAGAGHSGPADVGCSSLDGSSRAGRSRKTTCSTSAGGWRMSPVACMFATGLIGTGMFTSVPSTAIVLLLTGWIVVPEVRFAPTAASFRLKAEAHPPRGCALRRDQAPDVGDARTT